MDVATGWPVVSTVVDGDAHQHPSQPGAVSGLMPAVSTIGLLLLAVFGCASLAWVVLALLVGWLVAACQPVRR